ncbi:MAG: hypothetical protein U1C33_04095 [Candidatus Cloacimonadaceae bacterium]|nr:hypothetical protein [Candidatus Cloacimonadaceae bacterium]
MKRLIQSGSASNNQHYRPESVKERLSWTQKEAGKYRHRRLKYFDHRGRFMRYLHMF